MNAAVAKTDMKALIIRGKFTGLELEVSQWCNDWFMLDPNEDMPEADQMKIAHTPFSPTQLAFTVMDWIKLRDHKNNGMLFEWFEKHELGGKLGAYEYTFKKYKR